MNARRLLARVFLGSALAIAGCSRPAAPPIVLISIDTLRADHLSCYGHDRPTPAIDALAAEGVRYAEAHAAAPWTLPSHVSILTGRYPATHAVRDSDHRLADEVPMISEALQRAGYRTAGFVSHVALDAKFGVARGFDEFRLTQYENTAERAVRGEQTLAAAAAWLDEHADGDPYFLFFHVFDPHWPYAAPAPYRGRYGGNYRGDDDGSLETILRYTDERGREMPPEVLQHLLDLYDEEIAYTDDVVGQLVQRVRRLPGGDRAVFILTSDHGEEFREHGSLGHGYTLYHEQTHVPLIVSDPGAADRGVVIDTGVRSLDIAPTIGAIAGIAADDPFSVGIDGVALPRTAEAASRGARPIQIETTVGGPLRSATIVGERKAISPMAYHWNHGKLGPEGEIQKSTVASWYRHLQVFDRAIDPGEQKVLPVEPDDEAVRQLRAWEEQTWSGVLIELRLELEWEGWFELPEGAKCYDEPRLDNGVRILRILPSMARIPVKKLPPDTPLRLHLPVDPEVAGTLTIETTSGSLRVYAESGVVDLARGEQHHFDLTAPSFAAGGPAEPTLGSVVLRVRPVRQRPAERPFDKETEEALLGLGYVR